ncbi:hypothetical protein [Plantactinospora sp. ZYX-F-223]|uniref:hypothetical protein n=1 Tax=Plantactinospora sp. ZYX-F-223 TaxID=3144103 RepID=UPI0031FD8D43
MLRDTVAAGALGERVGILPAIATQAAAYGLAGAVALLALPKPAPVRTELAPPSRPDRAIA